MPKSAFLTQNMNIMHLKTKVSDSTHSTQPGGATTTGPDATPPPTICQNLGGGGAVGGRGSSWGSGGIWVMVKVWVTELVEPVLVL